VRAPGRAREHHVVEVRVHVRPLVHQLLARLENVVVDAERPRTARDRPLVEPDAQHVDERVVPAVGVQLHLSGLLVAQAHLAAVHGTLRGHAHIERFVVRAPVVDFGREKARPAAARVTVCPEVEPAAVELHVAVVHPHADLDFIRFPFSAQIGQVTVHHRAQ